MRCEYCDGEGVVWFICKRTNSWYSLPCRECHGDGEIDDEVEKDGE